MEGKAILSKLKPYKQGKQIEEIQAEFGLDRIVKLASNENPYGYSEEVKQSLLNDLPEFNIYPDGFSSKLRKTLSAKLNIDENQVIFGSGTEELIQLLCRTYLVKGSNTVMAAPTFSQYKHYALIEGAAVKEVPVMEDGYHDMKGMLDAVDEKTKIVWLCSPNNPTGTVIAKEDFVSFMEECPKHVLVAFDEAYFEYMNPDADVNALSYVNQYHNLIIMRTFSKAYGLAGLRIGYGIANSAIITALDIVRGPFNTTSIAQNAASVAIKDQSFIQDTYVKNKSVKASFEQFLEKLGWKYYDSETNFLLVSTPVSGLEIYEYLVKNGYIVRPGELLGVPNTVRITIGLQDDMVKLQKLLLQFNEQSAKV